MVKSTFFNHTGNSVTVINAKAATVSATIPLGGNPEFAVVDEAAGARLLQTWKIRAKSQ